MKNLLFGIVASALVFAPETEALLVELRRRTEAGERRRKALEKAGGKE